MMFVPHINVNRMRKYQLRRLSPIVLLSMMAISLFSCGKNASNGGCNDSISTDSSMAASKSSLSTHKINKGLLFLDISESMKGYTRTEDPTFFGVLSDFIYMDEDVIPYFYGKDKEEKSIEDIKNAINILNSKTFDWADESKLADMVLIDIDNYAFTPNYNFLANLIYSANSSCVDTVICNGDIVMENRHVNGEEEILENVRRIYGRLNI